MNAYKLMIAYYALSSKEVRRLLRIWPQTLLPPAITTSLYFLIFGRILGSQLILGNLYNYIDFIAPGLIIMSIITNAYSNTVSSFFSAKFLRSIEELLVSPMPSWTIVFGYMTGGIVRGMLVGVIVLAVSIVFSFHMPHHLISFAFICLLTSACASIAGIVNAFFAKKFDDVTIVPVFILTPLTYLGGVFYPIELLSEPWQIIANFNPLAHLIHLSRFYYLEQTSHYCHYDAFAMLIFTLVCCYLSIRLLNRGVRTHM